MSVQRMPANGLRTLALLSAFAFLDACSCGKTNLMPTDQCAGISGVQAGKTSTCTSNDECGDHFGCADIKDKAGVKCCVFEDRACTTEADCCPGQTCPSTRKKCFDKFVSCEKDADCSADQFCEVWTDSYGTSSRCRFHVCGSLGECPDGQSCFQGECMASLPCGGSCAAGQSCVPSTNQCQDYSMPTGRPMAACPMTCAAGFIATFKDERNLWDTCSLPPVACVCAELPGLQSNDLGRFSAIAADPGNALYVSEYDGQYGDLVVVKFGLDGKKIATEYVDGVPTGAVKYGPSGARGGVVEPGPDVGRYSDIAVSGGRAYVSYYDVSNGDLKVALRGTDGKWTNHRVDGATGDLGRYTSIAIDSAGKPGVSYFQFGAEAGFNVMDCPAPRPTGATKYITALKFAHANTTTPAADTDWTVKTVACQSRPAPICDACAGVCADPGTGPGCFTAATNCTATCDPNTQACVSNNGASVCATKFTPPQLQDVPVGIGLFSSLTFKDTDAVIAFMRRNAATTTTAAEGDLLGVTVTGAGSVGTPVVLDASGDTGWFPDVKLEPGSNAIAIGYHDFTSKAFKYYYAPTLQTGVTPEVIDTGLDPTAPGTQSFVGTDSAIVFTAQGSPLAVYQDPTRGDLKLAKRAASWVVQTPVATTGAVGFFADGVFSDGKIYASHARIHAKLIMGEPTLDNALLLEQITPP